MTQLLISVKNLAETQLALDAGVDIIDLKDPEVGALGALDLTITKQIVHLVDSQTLTSATAGEQHANLSALVESIEARANAGIDIIKIAIAEFYHQADFVHEMRALSQKGIQLVAVVFADSEVELARDARFFATLQNTGFYGAMLDTQHKQENLLKSIPINDLQLFTRLCERHQLRSGLAGSLQQKHVAEILLACPNYLGFRGGVCDNFVRQNSLCTQKITELKMLLFKSNKINGKAPITKQIALHS